MPTGSQAAGLSQGTSPLRERTYMHACMFILVDVFSHLKVCLSRLFARQAPQPLCGTA